MVRVGEAFEEFRKAYGCRRIARVLSARGHACSVGLVGDITYLGTGPGWLYWATVIDLATRMVVGWQIADHRRTSLITGAPETARLHGHLQPNAVARRPTHSRNMHRPNLPSTAEDRRAPVDGSGRGLLG